MHLLKDNVTFSLLDTCTSWRTDFTLRFCEYFAHYLHGESFKDFINLPGTVDHALQKCTTPYLIVVRPGYVPLTKKFFKKLEQQLVKNEDIFLGHVYLVDDYAIIDSRFIIFNIDVWRKAGSPKFNVNSRSTVNQFIVSSKSNDRDWPHEIVKGTSEQQNAERFCRENGAVIISKQLDMFSRATSISALAPEDCHFIDDSSSLSEIMSETEFELIYSPAIKNTITLIDHDDIDDIPDRFTTELLVSIASGLRTLDTVERIKPKKVIVFSANAYELELQKRIFGTQTTRIYGDILDEFQQDNPEARLAPINSANRHLVIQPSSCEVEYHQVNLFSYQILDLVRSIHHSIPAVFDFSDAFLNPINFYRRPMYQVQGLFGTLYSDIRSRTGIARIFGYAPGFKRMTNVSINSSNAQFEFKIEDVELEGALDRPAIFRPESSPQIKEKLVAKSLFQRIKSAVLPATPFATPATAIIPELEQEAEKIVLPHVRKPSTWATRALRMGYKFDAEDPNTSITTLYKHNEPIGDVRFIYYYEIDEATGKWSFRVSIHGEQKRILIEDGNTQGTFIAHLLRDSKIDPVSAAKMLGK
jgi:hypothetical protein